MELASGKTAALAFEYGLSLYRSHSLQLSVVTVSFPAIHLGSNSGGSDFAEHAEFQSESEGPNAPLQEEERRNQRRLRRSS